MFRATHRLWFPAAVMAESWQLPATTNVCKNHKRSWLWAVCRSTHVEQLRNIRIINSTTRLHLVSYFYTVWIMMHGSMNIKEANNICCKNQINPQIVLDGKHWCWRSKLQKLLPRPHKVLTKILLLSTSEGIRNASYYWSVLTRQKLRKKT